MAVIRVKLKQLRDADVRFISLVDRAATRMPLRVMKQEKEMIDLMRVFKSDDKVTVKPVVSGLVVFAHPEGVNTQIKDALTEHGFVTDRVQKADEDKTVVYAQADQPKEVHVVRLSDQLLASVGGLTIPTGWVGDLVEQHGFIPDLKMATAALYDQLEMVAKSETPQADVKPVLDSFGSYLDQVMVLPAECFKLDEAIRVIVEKSAENDDTVYEDGEPVEVEKDEKPEEKVEKAETEEEKAARLKKHPPSEMAPADEEDDQKPPPEEVGKSDSFEGMKVVMTDLLKGMEARTNATLTTLTQKVESVVAEQSAQKKVLDGVVQKADTLNDTLKTTVIANPTSEDRPAMARVRVEKDDDPRRGNFDTAYLRRRK